MKNRIICNSPFSRLIGFVFIILISVLFVMVVFFVKMTSNGKNLGKTMGVATGRVIGSIEGIAQAQEAYEAGMQQGLSNEDICVEKVENVIKKTEKLEVLVTSVKLKNLHNVGENTEYAALYLLYGDAVYTVDLSKSEIKEKNGEVYISIPKPKVELKIDPRKIEKIAEYQKHFFSGSAENGYDDYINMMKKIAEESETSIANSEELMQSAEAAAIKQIKSFAEGVISSQKNIQVIFNEEEEK